MIYSDRRGASTVGKAMDDLLGALKATPVDASSLSRESGNTAIQLSKGFHGAFKRFFVSVNGPPACSLTSDR